MSGFEQKEIDEIMLAKYRIRDFLNTCVTWSVYDAIKREEMVVVGSNIRHFFIDKEKSPITSMSFVCLDSADMKKWTTFLGANNSTSWDEFVSRDEHIKSINVPVAFSHVFSRALCINVENSVGNIGLSEPAIKDIKLYLATDLLKTREDIIKYQLDTAPKISYTGYALYISEDSFRGMQR